MKKIVIAVLLVNLVAGLIAGDLVMIKSTTNMEIQTLSGLENLSINYLGNGFILATKTGDIKAEYMVIENNAWKPGWSYFLVFVNKTKNSSYLAGTKNFSETLYQTEDLTFIRVSDQKLAEVNPPVDGSITLLQNAKIKLPTANIKFSQVKADPDPFIVARLAEVNTTLMQTNLQHLQDYGTRNAYNAQSVLAQNWIKQQFESYGLSTQLFDFTMPSGSASDNVIATKTGTLYPNEYVIIGGHYDSYTGSSSNPAPGADDNASGTCGVLEVARILAPYSYDRTIIFCAFSGEEYGLYGSAAYATWCDNMNLNILGYLNMDMIGYLKSGDPVHTDIIAPASAQDLVSYYTSVVNLYLPTFITAPGALSGGDSDHTSFNNHGFMGIFPFEDSQDYSPYIHTTGDVIGQSVNNFTQVGVFTKAILATTVSLANMVTPPRNLVAIPGNGFITLTWDQMQGVDGYNIYKNGNPSPVGSSITPVFVDDEVVTSTTYTYYVTAIYTDSGEESDPSDVVSITYLPPMAYPFVENFEQGLARWNLDSPWGLATDSYHSATRALTESPSGNYTNNLNASARLYPFSLSTATSASFTFWTKYNMEANYDYTYLEASTNGTNWTQLTSYNGTQSTWVQKTVSLSAYLGQPYVCLRFRFYSDVSVVSTGMYIDDINLSVASPSTYSLSLTAFLEGPFNGASMNASLNGLLPLNHPFSPSLPYFGNPNPEWYFTGTGSVGSIPNTNIVDWVLVELRDAWNADAALKVTTTASLPAFILSNGSIVGLDGSSPLQYSGPVYNKIFALIYHRNHCGVMTASEVNYSAGSFTYNFSTGVDQVYGGGSSHKELAPGIWGLPCGDGNGDGLVLDNDKDALWDLQASQSGYLPSDYNMDGQSDNNDKNDWWMPNLGIGSLIPD